MRKNELFTLFRVWGPQTQNVTKKWKIHKKNEKISISRYWSKMAPERPKKPLGLCRVGALGPQNAVLDQKIEKSDFCAKV